MRALLVSAVWCALATAVFWGTPAPDLAALWFAAHFLAEGRADLVYEQAQVPIFTTSLGPEWLAEAEAVGYMAQGIPLYPYIYPPIWAELVAPVTRIVGWQAFCNMGYALCAISVAAAAWATHVIARPQVRLALWMAICLCLGSTMVIVSDGLRNAQLQLPVTALVLGCFALLPARGAMAGGMLGLAAALKLSPAPLAVLFLKPWRPAALAGFVAIGGGLGVLSVILAGWPLHEVFLGRVESIGNSIVVTHRTFSLQALLHQLTHPEGLTIAATLPGGDTSRSYIAGYVTPKVPWLFMLNQLALVIGALAIYRKRADFGRVKLPALLLLLALTGPISWSYHYLPALFFIFTLPLIWGAVRGGVMAALILLPLVTPIHAAISLVPVHVHLGQLAGTLAMGLAFFAFVLAPREA